MILGLEMPELLLVLAAAAAASTVAAVTGTGGGILLLPVLVTCVGVRDAIPAYTLAQFIGNLSRVYLNQRDIRLDVATWFVAGAMPAAVLGAFLFARTDEQYLLRLLGVFLLLTVLWRHWRKAPPQPFPVARFAGIGAVFGIISAYLGSAGPFLAPFFLAFGLTRGAYIGTEALGTCFMHAAKLASYGALAAFSQSALLLGLSLSPVMVGGSYAGKHILDRIPPAYFVTLVEIILVLFGLLFLIRG